MSVPSPPHSHQHLLFLVFTVIAILIGVRWYLLVFWIFISLRTNNVEHLFMGLLAICISSLEKISIQILCPFFTWLFCFLMLNRLSSFCILDTSLLSDISFENTFSRSVDCFSFCGRFLSPCKSSLVGCSTICLFGALFLLLIFLRVELHYNTVLVSVV